MQQFALAINHYYQIYNDYPIPKKNDDGNDHFLKSNDNEFLSILKGKHKRGYALIKGSNLTDHNGYHYHITFDTNNDGKINFFNQMIEQNVILHNYGRNGVNNKGKDDDLLSWK